MVLGKLPVCPTNLDYSRARPTALTVGAGGWRLFGHFFSSSIFLSPSLSGRRFGMDRNTVSKAR